MLIFRSNGVLEHRQCDKRTQQWVKKTDAGNLFGSYLQAASPEKGLAPLPLASEITRMVRKLGPEDICVGNAHNVREWTTPVAFKLDGGKIQLAENLEQLARHLKSLGYVKIAGQEITELGQLNQLPSDNRLVELEGTDNQKIELKLLTLDEAEQDLKGEMDRIRDNNISHLAADLDNQEYHGTNINGGLTTLTRDHKGEWTIRWHSHDKQNWYHSMVTGKMLIFRLSNRELKYYAPDPRTGKSVLTDTSRLFESYLQAAP
jgi:frataxin-like iron-binding protein CyaY